MRPRLLHVLALVLLAMQLISATCWVLAYQSADDDTGEAVRVARTCLADGLCQFQGVGVHTSLLGFRHGASLVRLIAHYLESGGGLRSVQITLLALLMAAEVVSFFVIARFVSLSAGLLSLLLYLQPTIATTDFNRLGNLNLLSLPLALYYGSAALCVASGSVVAGIIGAVCLAAAISANLTCAVLVPFHIGLIWLFARRPQATAAAACTALVIAFTLESYASACQIVRLLVHSTGTLAVVLAAAIFLALRPARQRLAPVRERLEVTVRQLRKWLASLPLRLRLRVTMKAAIVHISVVLWTAFAMVGSFPGHYLAVLVFPLLFLAVEATEQLSRRALVAVSIIGVAALVSFPWNSFGLAPSIGLIVVFSGVVAVATLVRAIRWGKMFLLGRDPLAAQPALTFFLVGVVLMASVPEVSVPRDRQLWPVRAAEKVATTLYAGGYTFPQLLASVQRLPPGTVEEMIAILDPDLLGQPPPVVNPGYSLLALIIDSAAAKNTEGVVLTFPINRTRTAIVVRAPSYLDRTHLRTCYLRACGGDPDPETCRERAPERPVRHLPPFFQIGEAETVVPGKTFSYQPEGRNYCIVFSTPIHTPGAGVPHIIRVADQWPLTLRITRVNGVDSEGQLPGAEVLLTDKSDSSGTLEVQVSSNGLGPSSDWLMDAPLIEVALANQHLLEPFRNRRSILW